MIDPVAPDFADTPLGSGRPGPRYAAASEPGPPRVLVVTPPADEPRLLAETACSLVGQSLQEWEWAILLAGDALVETEGLSDPRVRTVAVGDASWRDAVDSTVSASKADFVLTLHAGDLLEPTALEKWLWLLESHSAVGFVDAHSVNLEEESLDRGGFHRRLAALEGPAPAAALVRKGVFEAAGGYGVDSYEGLGDWDLWLRCASIGYWGTTIPEFLLWSARPGRTTEPNPARAAALRRRYPRLWEASMPQTIEQTRPGARIPHELPLENRIEKSRRRILLITALLTVGGADRFNLDLIEQLDERGWQTTVAATVPGDHPWLPLFARETPDVFVLPHLLRLADYPRFLRYLIDSRQCDAVLVTNSELGYRLLPYLRAHCPNVAFLDFCHSEIERWQDGGYPRFSVDYQDALDLTIVASRHLCDWMIRRGADGERIEVCYANADAEGFRLDPEARAAGRVKLAVHDDTPIVLFVGRVGEDKQPAVLGATLARLHREGHRFAAVVAGDGPDLPALRSFARDEGLDGVVRFLGNVRADEVRALLGAADVLFLPSLWEGIALTLYEAMAAGLAVVAADVGGQSELVTPDCGILVPPGEQAAEVRRYAGALGSLLDDPKRRRVLGEAGRARVLAEFPLREMGERMATLLERAQALHADEPRPVAAGLARAAASETIDHHELIQHGMAGITSRRIEALVLAARALGPFYSVGMRLGLTWLAPAKARIKQAILPPSLKA